MGPLSTGTDDPLKARAMVVQSGSKKLALVGIDLVKIRLDLSDKAIELVSLSEFLKGEWNLQRTWYGN